VNGKYPDEDLGFGCGGATDAKVRTKSKRTILLLLFKDYYL